MALVLTEEHELVRGAARDFVAARSPRRRARAGGFARELWREMARLGWLGLTVPEAAGGSGLGWVAQMLVGEELGRGLVPEALAPTVLAAACLPPERLPAVVHGDELAALAYLERGARFDAGAVATRADADGRLRGHKTLVLGGASADLFVVSARAGEAVELYLVTADAPGLARRPLHLLDGRDAAELDLDDVRPAAHLPGGAAQLARALDRGTIALAAEMLGGMSAAFQLTLDHLKTRVQFGVPIGSFQALQHRAAKLFVEIELARSAVWSASALLDDGGDDAAVARAASVAKAKCSDAFLLVAHEAVQMHGGIGMTDEHDIGLYLKRARVAEMTLGDARHHRDRFARLLGF
jgi:alkylation response protein AidB-like acyl-CoA dehydrogenase